MEEIGAWGLVEGFEIRMLTLAVTVEVFELAGTGPRRREYVDEDEKKKDKRMRQRVFT